MQIFRIQTSIKNIQVHAPSSLRNRVFILEQLKRLFQDKHLRLCVEIASGTGAHIEHYAPAFPDTQWQPSRGDSERRQSRKIGDRLDISITELQQLDASGSERFSNVSPSIALDISSTTDWKGIIPNSVSLIIVANITHISPWDCTTGLFRNSAKYLQSGGSLLVYGPFNKTDNVFSSGGNKNFDGSLRKRNPEWGLRNVSSLVYEGELRGIKLVEQVDMPANNMLLVFEKE